MFFGSKSTKGLVEVRKQQQQVAALIRRLIDTNTPNLYFSEETNRTSERVARCLPSLVANRTSDRLANPVPLFAMTRDFSDNGVSMIVSQEIDWTEVYCGFVLDVPRILLGVVQRKRYFGGGMYELGIELTAIDTSAELLESLRSSFELLTHPGVELQSLGDDR